MQNDLLKNLIVLYQLFHSSSITEPEKLGILSTIDETLKALDVTTFEQKLEICNILGESIGQHDAVSIESRITSVLDDWSTQKNIFEQLTPYRQKESVCL